MSDLNCTVFYKTKFLITALEKMMTVFGGLYAIFVIGRLLNGRREILQ